MIGSIVKVTIDRPLGSRHPKHKDIIYPINYGYIDGIMAADGEEQDAYVLGVHTAVKEFTGKVIAVIHRNDDMEEKWVVAPDGVDFSDEDIARQVHFQEQYFDYVIKR
ncbi:MAG: inorganic pyrophosphatase [Clostridia bacterium]|nr:inorganic pyrophosphatase [Clostridia bacterium]